MYGYCPTCGAEGVSRGRGINGNDTCKNGHVYPSKTAYEDLIFFNLNPKLNLEPDLLPILIPKVISDLVTLLGGEIVDKESLFFRGNTVLEAPPLKNSVAPPGHDRFYHDGLTSKLFYVKFGTNLIVLANYQDDKANSVAVVILKVLSSEYWRIG